MRYMHFEATVEINSDRDLIEYPLCENIRVFNSGLWRVDIEDVTCPECLDIISKLP